MTDKLTNTVAGAAAVSPWWLPTVADVSHAATIALPILGCVWLLVQLTAFFLARWRG